MRKMSLIVLAAIAAMVFTAPSTASATEWTVGPGFKTSFSGPVVFHLAGGWGKVSCEANAGVTLPPGNTGSVDSFQLQACAVVAGTGILDECKVETASAQGLPWTLKAESTVIDLANLKANFTLKKDEDCYMSNLTFNEAFEHVKLTPDKAKEISTLTFSSGKGTRNGNPSSDTVSGTLTASQPGVYGIGADGNWSWKTTPLAKATTVTISGNLRWERVGNGMECTGISGEVTLLPGDDAEFGEFTVNPNSCSGFGSSYKGCQANEVFAGNEGPVSATGAGEVAFSEFYYVFLNYSSCANVPNGFQTWATGEVTATPDHSSAISSLSINDEVSFWSPTSGEGATTMLYGSLNVTPAGVYGIAN